MNDMTVEERKEEERKQIVAKSQKSQKSRKSQKTQKSHKKVKKVTKSYEKSKN